MKQYDNEKRIVKNLTFLVFKVCVELHKSCKKDTALCSRTMHCHQRNLQEKCPQFKNGEISLTSALKYQRVEFVENIAVSGGLEQKSRYNLIKKIKFFKGYI